MYLFLILSCYKQDKLSFHWKKKIAGLIIYGFGAECTESVPVLISFSGYGLFIEELSGSDAICEVDNISKL